MALEMFHAVRCSKHDVLTKLLRESKDIDHSCQDQNGNSLLVVAVKSRNSTAVKQLIQHGFPPDLTTSGQTATALLHAVQLDLIEIAKILLGHGAKCSESILLTAISSKNTEMINLLLSHGGKINQGLPKAVELNSTQMVKVLLKEGSDPDERESSASNRTSLMIAASKGYEDITQLLLKSRATVNATDYQGHTAIHYAAAFQTQIDVSSFIDPKQMVILPGEKDFAKIMRNLHSSGANVNAVNVYGWTALHLAAKFGHAKLIQVLVELGADINAKDKDGLTALMIAVGGTKKVGAWRQIDKTACFTPSINYAMRTVAATTVDFVNVVNQLLASGTNININAQDNIGRTALMHAIRNSSSDYLQYVTLLTNAGTDPLIKSQDNKTAAEVAVENGRDASTVAMLRALEHFGAAVGAGASAGVGGKAMPNGGTAQNLTGTVLSSSTSRSSSSSRSAKVSLGTVAPATATSEKAVAVTIIAALTFAAIVVAVTTSVVRVLAPSVALQNLPILWLLLSLLFIFIALAAQYIVSHPTTKSSGTIWAKMTTNFSTSAADGKSSSTATASTTTWLAGCLAEYNVSPALVQLCEEKLVRQEGFFTAQLLAATDPATKFHTAYLRSLDISALGLQKALLGVHATLRQSMSQRQDQPHSTAAGARVAAAEKPKKDVVIT